MTHEWPRAVVLGGTPSTAYRAQRLSRGLAVLSAAFGAALAVSLVLRARGAPIAPDRM